MLYVCISLLCTILYVYVYFVFVAFSGFSFVAFFLQYFDTVGWVFWPVRTVSHITYTVLVGTLTHAQSIILTNHRLLFFLFLAKFDFSVSSSSLVVFVCNFDFTLQNIACHIFIFAWFNMLQIRTISITSAIRHVVSFLASQKWQHMSIEYIC